MTSPITWALFSLGAAVSLGWPATIAMAPVLSAMVSVAAWRSSRGVATIAGLATATLLLAWIPPGTSHPGRDARRLAAAHDALVSDLASRARAAMANSRTEDRFRALLGGGLPPGLAVTLHDPGSRPIAWAGDAGHAGHRSRFRLQLDGGSAVLELSLDSLAERLGIRATVEPATTLESAVAPLTLHGPDGAPSSAFGLRPARARAPTLLALLARVMVALLAVACALACAPLPALAPRLVAVASALAARLVLADAVLEDLIPAFRPGQLAIVTPFHLFSSPGDVLCTGLVAAVIAFLLAAPWPAISAFRGAVSTLCAWCLGAVGAVALMSLLRRLAENAALDLADSSLIPFEAARLCAVAGTTLLMLALQVTTFVLAYRGLGAWAATRPEARALAVLAWLTCTLAAANFGLRTEPGLAWPEALALVSVPLLLALAPARLPGGRRVAILALAALASAMALQGAAHHYAQRALGRFVEQDLAELMRRHERSLRWLLDNVLAEFQSDANADFIQRPPEEVAYLAWRRSRLASEALRAAVDVQRPDGAFARFAHRLPVPAHSRGVQPGRVTLQDFLFQGRSLRVLAGATRLSDGTIITLRVGEDDGESSFFPEVHYLAEALATRGSPHEGWVARAGAEITVLDTESHLLHSSSARVFPVDRSLIARAQERPEGFWWSAVVDGRPFDAFSFMAGDRVLNISLPRPDAKRRVAAILHRAIHTALIAAITSLALIAFVPSSRALLLPPPAWIRRSYFRTVSASFTVAALVPALAFAAYLQSTLESQKLNELRERTLTALEFARRILAEFSAADPLAPIDDSTLIWVAQTVGHDLSLFRGPELQATSVRDLFREGLLSPLPPAAAYLAVALEGRPIRIARVPTPRNSTADLRLDVSASMGDQGMITLYAVGHRSDVAYAATDRSLVLFLGTASLLVAVAILGRWLARRATEPVRALTAATARIAAGDADVRIATQSQDELQTLVDSFNRMAETVHSQRIELRTRAAYLTRLLENATTGVVSINHEGTVTTINQAAKSLLDHATMVVGCPFLPAIAGAALAPLSEALARPARSEVELTLGADGARRVRVVVLPLPEGDEQPPGRLLLLADVSELVRTKKLEAWAEMARRIAHEIKNPLTPIQLAAEHLRRVFHDGREGFGEVLDSCVSTILRQVDDLRRITREFSAYAADPAPLHRREVAIGPWLLELTEPYRSAAPPGVIVEAQVSADCGPVPMDDARMRRAIVNLIENALNAMPKGGRLGIRARRLGVGAVEIEVADDGIGIPPDVLPRVFEPYFSTRDAGTGLGLANAKRTVEEHGGTITVVSDGKRGTVVTVTLPTEAQDGR